MDCQTHDSKMTKKRKTCHIKTVLRYFHEIHENILLEQIDVMKNI